MCFYEYHSSSFTVKLYIKSSIYLYNSIRILQFSYLKYIRCIWVDFRHHRTPVRTTMLKLSSDELIPIKILNYFKTVHEWPYHAKYYKFAGIKIKDHASCSAWIIIMKAKKCFFKFVNIINNFFRRIILEYKRIE